MLNDYRQMKQYQQDRFDRFSAEACRDELAEEAVSNSAQSKPPRREGFFAHLFKPRRKLTHKPIR